MKNSKYIDVSAAMQIIGNIYNNPSLLLGFLKNYNEYL